MRRATREVTDFDQQVEIMKASDVCRIAFNGAEIPYILPLNFGIEVIDGVVYLYFHGAKEGMKYDYIREHPIVAFEMDCRHRLLFRDDAQYCTMAYASVTGKGRIELLPDEEKVHALILLNAHYHPDGFPVNLKSVPATTVMRLTVLEMTAKSNLHKLNDPNMHGLDE